MKYAIPVLAAALALAGCDTGAETADAGSDAEAGAIAESTTATTDNGTMAAPTATESVVAAPSTTAGANDGTTTVITGTSVTVDGRHVDAKVGPEGVTATVKTDR